MEGLFLLPLCWEDSSSASRIITLGALFQVSLIVIGKWEGLWCLPGRTGLSVLPTPAPWCDRADTRRKQMTLCHLLFVTLLVSPVGQRWWCPVKAGGRAFTWQSSSQPNWWLIHDLKPDFDNHELLPRLLSRSLLPGLVGVCVAGQVDRFGNVSCACLGLCLCYEDISWVGPDGILAGVSPVHPTEMEDRTFN